MKKRILLTIAAMLIAFSAHSAFATGTVWVEDFELAKQTARSQGKDLLINFTGSDWCGWCMKLDKEVFGQSDFLDRIQKEFILVKIDFPKRIKQTEAVKIKNDQLARQYGAKGFPTIILTDSDGFAYGKTGYRKGGVENYLDHVSDLKQIKSKRDGLIRDAESAQGLQAARKLDEAYALLTGMGIRSGFDPRHVARIIELDTDNKAGLKKKFTSIKILMDADNILIDLSATDDYLSAGRLLDVMILDASDSPILLQKLYVYKAEAYSGYVEDAKIIKEILNLAVDAAPDTPLAGHIKKYLSRM